MRFTLHHTIAALCLSGFAWIGSTPTHAAAASSSEAPGAADPNAAQADTNQIHVLSVFIDDPMFGKDPFFPNSDRRKSQAPKNPVPDKPEKTITLEMIYQELELKGISLGSNRKLAIINNYTLEEGEIRDLKIQGRKIKVECNRIEERSAFITVDGQVRIKLTLREGI